MGGNFPRGAAAIVSAATWGCGEAPGYTSMELAARATRDALAAVGLTPADADALFICLPDEALSGLSFAQYLGVHPKITDNNRTGGSSFQTHVIWASLALQAGLCDTAVVAYGSVQRSAAGKLVSAALPDPFESPFRPRLPVTAYALAAARHMHEFGTTSEDLAEVAVAARAWAGLNPEAFVRSPLTAAEVLNARRVSDPLGVLDCCLVTDGGGAIVLTRAERARDLCARPAYVLGGAAATSHNTISAMPDLTCTALAEAAPRAFAQAGYSATDMDMFQLYDAFTINPILFVEDLGLCPKGEGGRYLGSGRARPGGGLAMNTNGGGLSCCHPGMYGLFTLIEAFRQISGTAGARQLERHDLAVAQGNGGFLSSQALVILGSAVTL